MIFRLAREEDIDAVARIYEHVHEAEAQGLTTTGWLRGVYPVKSTAEAALERGDLYVCEMSANDIQSETGDAELGGIDEQIVATAIINQIQVDVYEGANWSYEAPGNEVCVLHTLAVDPTCHKNGIGARFVEFYESVAREMGCTVLRMDTNANNTIARAFYPRFGYRECDVVPTVFNGIPGVDLVLMEKKL